MIFTELVLTNFGAYSDRQTINLRPNNNGTMHPIVLFGGMNGGGKTTLMDAIRLALYGQRAKCSGRGNMAYGDFLTRLVNKQTLGEQNTEIELSFESIFDNHWQTFTIVRSWRRNPSGKDSLSIKREGDYDRTLEANWDEYIESVLPLGISNLFLFDGEQVKELAELDAPPAMVVEAINNLLGLELAEKLCIDLEVLANKKRKELASRKQLATIEEIEQKIHAKKELEAAATDALHQKIDELKRVKKQRDKAVNKFAKEGGKIADERDRIELEKTNLNNRKKELEADLIALSQNCLPLGLIENLLTAAVTTGRREIEALQLQQAKSLIAKRDRQLLEYLKEIEVNQDYSDRIAQFLQQQNQELEKLLDNTAFNLGITPKQLQQLENVTNNILPLQQQQSVEIQHKLQEVTSQLNRIEAQLEQAASPEAYLKLKSDKEQAENRVSQLQSDVEFARKHRDKLTAQKEQARRELKNYSETIINRDNSEHIVNSIAKVQHTLKLFKHKLKLKKLNKLETEVGECFRYLLAKSNLVNRIAIDSDTYALTLYDFEGKLLPKQQLSAGEKQLLAIAFLWSLARVSGKKLPVAIDTPLGRLDSSHRRNLIERYFPHASHQVILLSTDTEIGKTEIVTLREQEAIAREYCLQYQPETSSTAVKDGYFW